MSKWDFIKELIKEANKIDNNLKNVRPNIVEKFGEHYNKDFLRQKFNKARTNPNEMDFIRTRFDPEYKNFDKELNEKYTNKNIYNDNPYDFSLDNAYFDRAESNYEDMVDSWISGKPDERPDLDELETYRALRDNKNYLKPEIVQEYYDDGYKDFIMAIKQRIAKGENPEEAARSYLYKKHNIKDW